MKTVMSRLALLLGEIYEMLVSVVIWGTVIFVGVVLWNVFTSDAFLNESWKCYSEGRIVAEGETREAPKWHGDGYVKLPDGRVIEGECRW